MVIPDLYLSVRLIMRSRPSLRHVSLALLVCAGSALFVRPPAAGGLLRNGPCHRHCRRSRPIVADGISKSLAQKLQKVRDLRPTAQTPALQASLWKAAGLNPTYKVSGIRTGEPSFTRLFGHETWQQYTGTSPFRRWLRTTRTWRFSTILAALWPIIIFFTTWAFAIASLPKSFLPRVSPIPLTLMGSAIGLLLVFRTNNTYQRLNEVRILRRTQPSISLGPFALLPALAPTSSSRVSIPPCAGPHSLGSRGVPLPGDCSDHRHVPLFR